MPVNDVEIVDSLIHRHPVCDREIGIENAIQFLQQLPRHMCSEHTVNPRFSFADTGVIIPSLTLENIPSIVADSTQFHGFLLEKHNNENGNNMD